MALLSNGSGVLNDGDETVAYRRSTRSRSSYRRRPSRAYRAPARRTTRRRAASRRSGQVVRLVIEQSPGASLARAPIGLKAAPAPRKAAF